MDAVTPPRARGAAAAAANPSHGVAAWVHTLEPLTAAVTAVTAGTGGSSGSGGDALRALFSGKNRVLVTESTDADDDLELLTGAGCVAYTTATDFFRFLPASQSARPGAAAGGSGMIGSRSLTRLHTAPAGSSGGSGGGGMGSLAAAALDKRRRDAEINRAEAAMESRNGRARAKAARDKQKLTEQTKRKNRIKKEKAAAAAALASAAATGNKRSAASGGGGGAKPKPKRSGAAGSGSGTQNKLTIKRNRSDGSSAVDRTPNGAVRLRSLRPVPDDDAGDEGETDEINGPNRPSDGRLNNDSDSEPDRTSSSAAAAVNRRSRFGVRNDSETAETDAKAQALMRSRQNQLRHSMPAASTAAVAAAIRSGAQQPPPQTAATTNSGSPHHQKSLSTSSSASGLGRAPPLTVGGGGGTAPSVIVTPSNAASALLPAAAQLAGAGSTGKPGGGESSTAGLPPSFARLLSSLSIATASGTVGGGATDAIASSLAPTPTSAANSSRAVPYSHSHATANFSALSAHSALPIASTGPGPVQQIRAPPPTAPVQPSSPAPAPATVGRRARPSVEALSVAVPTSSAVVAPKSSPKSPASEQISAYLSRINASATGNDGKTHSPPTAGGSSSVVATAAAAVIASAAASQSPRIRAVSSNSASPLVLPVTPSYPTALPAAPKHRVSTASSTGSASSDEKRRSPQTVGTNSFSIPGGSASAAAAANASGKPSRRLRAKTSSTASATGSSSADDTPSPPVSRCLTVTSVPAPPELAAQSPPSAISVAPSSLAVADASATNTRRSHHSASNSVRGLPAVASPLQQHSATAGMQPPRARPHSRPAPATSVTAASNPRAFPWGESTAGATTTNTATGGAPPMRAIMSLLQPTPTPPSANAHAHGRSVSRNTAPPANAGSGAVSWLAPSFSPGGNARSGSVSQQSNISRYPSQNEIAKASGGVIISNRPAATVVSSAGPTTLGSLTSSAGSGHFDVLQTSLFAPKRTNEFLSIKANKSSTGGGGGGSSGGSGGGGSGYTRHSFRSGPAY